MASSQEPASGTHQEVAHGVRDPLAATETVLAARRRPMSQRLELALSWNTLAAELRVGLAAATKHADPGR